MQVTPITKKDNFESRLLRVYRENLVDQLSDLMKEGNLRIFFSTNNSVKWDGNILTITLQQIIK